MPSGGHNAKPTAQHRLEGSFREDRHGQRAEAGGTPRPPEWLDNEERHIWDSVVSRLGKVPGLLAEVDAEAIARYCCDWIEWHTARGVVHERGIVAVSEKGAEYQHPAVGTRNKAHERLVKFEARFGMTPIDRARIHVDTETPSETAAKYLG